MPSESNPIYGSLSIAGKFEEIIEIAKNEDTIESKYWEITALFRLGEVQKSQEKLNKCKLNFVSPEWQLRCYNLQSLISKNLGDFETAIESAKQCITFSEEMNSEESKEMRGIAYSNIAEVNRILGNLPESLDNYFQGYNIFLENAIRNEIEIFMLNIGITYRNLGRVSEAEEFLQENYRIALNKGNPQYLTYSLVELIELEVRRDLDKAKEYLTKMQDIWDENKSNKRIGLHCTYASALVYKFAKRNRDKVKAELLFEELIKTNEIEVYYTLEAIPHLIELLLIEYSNYGEPVVVQEIERLLVLLYNLGTQKRMNKYIIKSLIIQSKLKQLKGNYRDAGMLLDDAEEICKKFDLSLLLNQISGAKEELAMKIDNHALEEFENDLYEGRMEISGLIDYLRKVQGAFEDVSE